MRRFLFGRVGQMLLPFTFGIFLLVIWETIIRLNDVPPYIMPGPVDIVRALTHDGADLMAGLLVTLRVTLAALALAAVTGTGFAFMLAQSPLLERALFPYAVFLQVTPIVTVAPFIIIWVSDIFFVLLTLAWMAALFPILSNTLHGLKSTDSNLQDLFRLYRASRWQKARHLLLPSALPHFLAGLRISGGLALIGTVVAEMVAGTSGTQSGLASRLLEASYRLELARAMACFFLLSLAGFALYAVLDFLSHRLLRHWHESARISE